MPSDDERVPGVAAHTPRWWVGRVAAVVAMAVLFVAPLVKEFHFGVAPQDEGLILVYPSLLLHGGVANKTFNSTYGSTYLWMVAAAFKVAGVSVTVERWVGVLFRLLIVASVATLAWRKRGPLVAVFAVTISVVMLAESLGLPAFAWLGALGCAAVGFVLLDVGLSGKGRGRRNGHRRRGGSIDQAVDVAKAQLHERRGSQAALKTVSIWALVGAGMAFGLAIGTRVDMGLAIGLACVAVVIAHPRAIPWLAIGFVVGLIPTAINLAQIGPAAFYRYEIYQPVFVSGPWRHLSLASLGEHEIGLLFLCVAVAAALTLSGLRLAWRRRTAWDDSGILLAIGLFDLAILPQAFQRSDLVHLSFVACFVLPTAVLLPAWCPQRIRAFLERWTGRHRTATSCNLVPWAAIAVVLVLAEPLFLKAYVGNSPLGSNQPGVFTVTHDGRSVNVGLPANQVELRAMLKVLDAHAQPGDRIFVGPSDLRTAQYSDTYLYYLLPHFTPGSFYLEMNPGVANAKGSGLAGELARDQFLILNANYNGPMGTDAQPIGPDAPNRVVATRFHSLGIFWPWTLYEADRPS